jgi:hypothetical protein
VIDARGRGRRHLGLGVIGDAEPGRLDHRDVVRPVAGDQGLVRGDAEPTRELDQGCELALAAEDGLGHLAGQPAGSIEHQRVGAVLVEAEHGGDACREQRETAGDETGIGAVPAQRRDQRARPGREPDPRGDDLVGHRSRQSLEQRHPLAQRRCEFDLAAHGALCDRRHPRLEPDVVRELVDAFLADDGRVHVSEKQRLAPSGGLLQHHVDRSAGKRLARALGQRTVVVFRRRAKGNVGGDAGVEPYRRLRRRQHTSSALDQRGIERGRRGI